MAEADAKSTRDNAPIQYCKFCNIEVLFKKNTDGKLILAGAWYLLLQFMKARNGSGTSMCIRQLSPEN